LNGLVVGIDLTNRWLEIRGTNGLRRIGFSTNVNVLVTGKRLPVEEVRVGDRVGLVARAETNGQLHLISLRVGARPPGDGNVKRIEKPATDR
jgi:hypothetical protein